MTRLWLYFMLSIATATIGYSAPSYGSTDTRVLPESYQQDVRSTNLNLVFSQNGVKKWFKSTTSLQSPNAVCVVEQSEAYKYLRANPINIELYSYKLNSNKYLCVINQDGENRFKPAIMDRLIVFLDNFQQSINTTLKSGKFDVTVYPNSPMTYGFDLKRQVADIRINYANSSKSYLQQQVYLNQNITACFPSDEQISEDLANNADVNLYQNTIKKQKLLCLFNQPGDKIIEKSVNNQIVINASEPDDLYSVNFSPSISQLIDYSDWKNTHDVKALILPMASYNTAKFTSLPSDFLMCTDSRRIDANYVMGVDQPVKLKPVIGLSSVIKVATLDKADAKVDNTPYKVLSNDKGVGLQPFLAIVSVNGNPPLDPNPELVYINNNTVCMSDDVITANKLSSAHKYFYEKFKTNDDPMIDSSLKCISVDPGKTNFIVDNQNGTLNLIVPSLGSSAQNINLGVSNEPIYPAGEVYANVTSYQIGDNQSNTANLSTNSYLGNFMNTTTTPIGSLMNNITVGTGNPLTRNSTYWQTDFPSTMTSLIIGDANPMIGSWGGSQAYAGLQYGSNEALRPATFFTATPIISGSVNVPTTADILLNGAQTNQIDLPAGNFNLYNLPIMNGDGSITVNLKNPDGDGYQSYTLPYYTSPRVLTNTTYLYQYNVGAPQLNASSGFNTSGYSFNDLTAATQHFIGITNEYTLELRAEAQQNAFANIGMAHNNTWFNKFATSVFGAVSQSESGYGGLAGFSISRQSSLPNTFGLGYNAKYMTNNFNQLGMINGPTYDFQQTVFANYNSSSGFNVAIGYSNNSAITDSSQMQLYNMTLNWQIIKNLLLTSSTSYTSSVGVNTFSSSLNAAYVLSGASAINAGYLYNNSGDDSSNQYQLGYTYQSPSNLWGYNVGGQYNDQSLADPTALTAGGYYLFKNFNANGSANYTNNKNYGYGASISGNAVIGANGLSLGQYSNLSFIIVSVGGIPNVGVKVNGTIMGSTDRNGYFVVPNVAAYLPQTVSINVNDLPFNVELDSTEKRVVAPLNGGARVVFNPVKYIPAMALLRYGNNKIPATGFKADIYNSDDNSKIEEVFITDDGMITLTKFSSNIKYNVVFTNRDGTFSCPISRENIVAQDSNEYITNVGTIQCIKK